MNELNPVSEVHTGRKNCLCLDCTMTRHAKLREMVTNEVIDNRRNQPHATLAQIVNAAILSYSAAMHVEREKGHAKMAGCFAACTAHIVLLYGLVDPNTGETKADRETRIGEALNRTMSRLFW